MNIVIAKLMKVIGWQKLLLMVWNAVQDDLKAHAAKTENKVDDNVIMIVDELVKVIAE